MVPGSHDDHPLRKRGRRFSAVSPSVRDRHADAGRAFEQMAPHSIERLRSVVAWMGHPELQIDYINAFTRIGDLHR